jgi:hypothetical protein
MILKVYSCEQKKSLGKKLEMHPKITAILAHRRTSVFSVHIG